MLSDSCSLRTVGSPQSPEVLAARPKLHALACMVPGTYLRRLYNESNTALHVATLSRECSRQLGFPGGTAPSRAPRNFGTAQPSLVLRRWWLCYARRPQRLRKMQAAVSASARSALVPPTLCETVVVTRVAQSID